MNDHLSLPYDNFNDAACALDGLQAIDFYLAQAILPTLNINSAFSKAKVSELFHLVIALSKVQRDGNSCLELKDISKTRQFTSENHEHNNATKDNKEGYVFSDMTELAQILNSLDLRGEGSNSPIVFEYEKLYLRRYWQFEVELAAFIKFKVQQNVKHNHNSFDDTPSDEIHCDFKNEDDLQKERVCNKEIVRCREILQVLFPHRENELDWQLIAVANALNKTFTIIAGGPGTGKTYTVTKLLAGLLMQNRDVNIAMVAPTGKAAQRLSESIDNAVSQFITNKEIELEILQCIPNQSSTIHRLLGVIPNSPNFRHNKQNPLSCDVLLVDEVSMVDLAMMTRLFRALPAHCRVILLGDAEQLPSVATGSVLADLAPVKYSKYSNSNQDFLQQCSGQLLGDTLNSQINEQEKLTTEQEFSLQNTSFDYLTYLVKSRRFDGSGGIGKIARMVICGDAKKSWQLLSNNQEEELTHITSQSLHDYLQILTKKYYKPIFKADSIEDAFACLNNFRILAPSRTGEFGLENLNLLIEQTLRKLNCVDTPSQLYKGRAIMISQNHYGINLFNGDIGILWPSERDKNRLVAVFVQGKGYREVSISRLPAFETVYAMTIHKTQGSEFKNVALVLPDQGSNRLLSRELIYTGITRAKSHLQIYCQTTTWHTGVSNRVDRASGLTSRLLAML